MSTSLDLYRFYNLLGEVYPESKIVYATPSGKARLKYISQILLPLRGKLLDVGCNNYVYERYWRDIYVGIDIASSLLYTGKRNGVCADAMCLPFQGSVFDYVLISEVLEHIETLTQRLKILYEIKRVLKPRGQLFLSAPNNPPYNPYQQTVSDTLWQRGISQSFIHGSFSQSYVRSLAKRTDFVIRRINLIMSPDHNTHMFCILEKKARKLT